MLKIPEGVTTITSARKFAGGYPQILREAEALPAMAVAIGIEQDDEIKLVAIRPERYNYLRMMTKQAEEDRILKAAAEAEEEYRRGETVDLDDSWFEAQYKKLGMKRPTKNEIATKKHKKIRKVTG